MIALICRSFRHGSIAIRRSLAHRDLGKTDKVLTGLDDVLYLFQTETAELFVFAEVVPTIHREQPVF
jgi:hypothetical protein